MKSPQDQVEISKPATVNNYKHFTEEAELENPITEGQQDRMGVSDLVGSGVPMEEAEGLDSPGSVKAAESLADNSSTTDPGASDKALTALVEPPQSQMVSLNHTGMESFGPVIEDLSGLASINTRPKTPVHRSGYMETPTNALFVTQGCSPLYVEGSFGNIDPERAPSPLVSYPSERQNFVDELETPDFLSHDVLLWYVDSVS